MLAVLAAVAWAAWHFGGGPPARPASAARPHAPVRAGDSKTTCIDSRLGQPLSQVEQLVGISYTCIEAFSNADPTWADWVSPWLIQPKYGYTTWLAAGRGRRQMILTMNLIPDQVASDSGWVAKCAAGDYDTYASELAANLAHAGFGDSVVRLGDEMNGTWNKDSLGTTPAQWRQWAGCFAQEVRSMRAVHGTHLLFDWNVNANYRDIPLADFYPGNSYVDIVGIDAYDSSGVDLPPVGSPARWAALAGEPGGLDEVAAFAAAHHKPLSIPEWGTVVSQGDDPSYVSHMASFVASHDVAFQSWFDSGTDGIFQLSRASAPRSLTAYRSAFG